MNDITEVLKMREIICYAARVAIPVWVVLSVLIVIKLIKDNLELENRLADALKTIEESIKNCRELSTISHGLIETDRKEIAIFESKTAEIEELRIKYECRIQEAREYIDSFGDRLEKCTEVVSANDAKVQLLDKDVDSCSRAVCLLINDVQDLKKNGVTLWNGYVSVTDQTCNHPLEKLEDDEK